MVAEVNIFGAVDQKGPLMSSLESGIQKALFCRGRGRAKGGLIQDYGISGRLGWMSIARSFPRRYDIDVTSFGQSSVK